MMKIPGPLFLSLNIAAVVLAEIALAPSAVASEHHPFDQWRAEHFTEAELLDETVSGPHADPGRDGLANLVKYAFGLEPKTPAREAHPQVIWDLERPTIRFTAAMERTGVELVLGVSEDLIEWERHLLDGNYPHERSIDVGGGREQITASPPAPAEVRQFLRLEIRLVGGDVAEVLPGLWHMNEITNGEDRFGNARNVVPDESGNARHLILGNRPGTADSLLDPNREPTLEPRGDDFALGFDGVNDVAYAPNIWGDPAEENYRITFGFNPTNPMASRNQILMITPWKFEIRMVHNRDETHARLHLIRWHTNGTLNDSAFSHWFQYWDTVGQWLEVEAIVNDGTLQIRVGSQSGTEGSYDVTTVSNFHHNVHYLGQSWMDHTPFFGLIDNLRIEPIGKP